MPDDLRAALDALRRLQYDDLTDLLDLIALRNEGPGAAQRRKGKKGGALNFGSAAALDAWQHVRALSDDDLRTVQGVAEALHRALAPQLQRRHTAEGQPEARGTVQLKTIPRKKLNLSTMEVETHIYGPYVYIRLWATGGDVDRRTSRLKSIYIPNSKALALAYQAGDVTAAAILDAYHNGTIYALCEQWASR